MESSVSRRNVLFSGALTVAATALEMTGAVSLIPARAEAAGSPSDIQFDIGPFSSPPTTINGVPFAFPPVHTVFLTAALQRKPTSADQNELKRVLTQLELSYPWGAASLCTFVAYGRPYFDRLNQTLVNARIPVNAGSTRSVLQNAEASPTDVVAGNGITKERFNVPVRLESNDLLFTLRSDNQVILQDVLSWFSGSNVLRQAAVRSPAFGGLLTFTSSRAMFVQNGLPRAVANQNNLPFRNFVNLDSPMWMGFADQQTNASGPAAITTFAGNASSHLTNAKAGDYFDNGSIQHLSHDILDLLQWFDMDTPTSPPGDDGVFTERVQYMFHSPKIDPGDANDQFTNGGGTAFLLNQNRGPNYARQTAQGIGTDNNDHRMGHLSTLQRKSRAGDGTPIHIRMDGPGFDNMDVPDGTRQPKLQFAIFVPTSDFFRDMRSAQAAQDLAQQNNVPAEDNGLERFITATRRQNFLIPPRRNRAFPLIELGA
jgi:hypothetical protein